MQGFELASFSQDIFKSIVSVVTALAVLLTTFVAAFQTLRGRNGSAAGGLTIDQIRELEKVNAPVTSTPFEVAALSDYYNQALRSARTAFLFSLTFASIGFGVIIFAFVSYQANDLAGAALKVVSGTVIDAVSGLFFIQSTSAQKNMGEFFEKLRLDRLIVEAREMIGGIEDQQLRDQLRAQMILKYSGIDKLLTDISTRPA